MKLRSATVDRFTPATWTVPCLVCGPHGRVMSGGPHGMEQLCGCCHGYAWHAPDTAPRCNPTEAA